MAHFKAFIRWLEADFILNFCEIIFDLRYVKKQ